VDLGRATRLGMTAEELGPGGVMMKTGGNVLAMLGSRSPSDAFGTRHAVISFLEESGSHGGHAGARLTGGWEKHGKDHPTLTGSRSRRTAHATRAGPAGDSGCVCPTRN
jgi:hypothetical protein